MRDKPIGLLAYLADQTGKFDNFGVGDGDAVWLLDFLINDGAEKLYEVNTANEKRNDAHVYCGTWPVVIVASLLFGS